MNTIPNRLRSTFVTGATGLLGNNLVRELVARGYAVKALVRSAVKGAQQFGDVPGVEQVVGTWRMWMPSRRRCKAAIRCFTARRFSR